MDTNSACKKIFADWIKEQFRRDLSACDIFIYGVELQVCGGILKAFGEGQPFTVIDFNLKQVGKLYDGHKCLLPEMCVPYSENAVVLVSLLYDYQYEAAAEKLAALGIPRDHIVHVRPLAEQLLKLSADYFAARRMDLKVKELFDGIGKDIGSIRYIDIGANNYLFYNNTYLFYRAGARGTLVEANPDFAEVYRQNRPGDKCLICGCSATEQGSMTYFKTNRAGYNTFLKKRLNKFGDQVDIMEELELPVRPINDILEEAAPDGHLDYLSVDIEGMGAMVVNAIDFERYTIDVILLEMGTGAEISRRLYQKLLQLGYTPRYEGVGGAADFLFYRTSAFKADA